MQSLKLSRHLGGLLLALWLITIASAPNAMQADDIIKKARFLCQQGSPQLGIELLEKSGLLRKGEEPDLQPDLLLLLADCYAGMGMNEQEHLTLKRGLLAAEKFASPKIKSEFLWRLGKFQIESGQSAQARYYLEQALQDIEIENLPEGRRNILMALGAVAASQEQYEEAEGHYRAAIEVAVNRRDTRNNVIARLNLSRVLIDSGHTVAAVPQIVRVHKLLISEPNSAWKLHQILAAGELYHRIDVRTDGKNYRKQAVSLLSEALEFARQSDEKRTESFALGWLGNIAEHSGEFVKALDYTRLAVFKAQQVQALDGLYLWQWQLARLLVHQGELEQAISAYQQSIDTLETIRPELLRQSTRVFREAVAPVFFEMADLLLKKPIEADSAHEQANLRLVRSTIERFKVAEIQKYFNEECVVEPGLEVELDRLAKNTAIIYPIIFADRLEVLTSFRGRIQRHTAKVTREQLTKTVRAFRKGLVRRPTHRYRVPGRALYSWLVEPSIKELTQEGIDTLIFVSDGPLRTIPPAALYDGNKFLIEDFAVASTLGLTLTSPKSIQSSKARVLAGGLIEPVEGFSPLPSVGAELDAISSMYRTTELRDKAFQLSPVTDQLAKGRYSIVHIATHGRFERDYRQSFLLTHDGRLTMDMLKQTVGSRRFVNEPLELLMLSACETAVGDDQAALGLVSIALKSGARSAVGSLWTINDFATSILVDEFYRSLKNPALTKAAALRNAQLKVLGDRRYAHPAAWSSFLLVGNWL